MATKKKSKYEVIPYDNGGFFISGGGIAGMSIDEREDADRICEALNAYDNLKLRRAAARINDAIYALEELQKAMKGQDA